MPHPMTNEGSDCPVEPDFRVWCRACDAVIPGADSGLGDEAPDTCLACAGEDRIPTRPEGVPITNAELVWGTGETAPITYPWPGEVSK